MHDLTPYERVILARDAKRPYTSDIIDYLFNDFVELSGDRGYADDPAIISGFAKFNNLPVAVVGHQKGRQTHERKTRNFGMPKPEGYRKALRVMRLAEKFDRTIITFIDTPGAYPGIDAEERGQAEAIAKNLRDMAMLRTGIITVVVGEGGSGGALGVGVCDKLVMLENAVYSVISPEGCSAILWKDSKYANLASNALKLTAYDLSKMNVVDQVVYEPSKASIENNEHFILQLSKTLTTLIEEIRKEPLTTRITRRYQKLKSLGAWIEN